jgi:cytochrome b
MNKILVWDLPLRLFHWLLVLLVVVSVVSVQIGGNAMQVHMRSGYAVLTLLLFRVLWGFLGGTHARFASFVRGPGTVFAYLRGHGTSRHLGHNPAGAWSVVLMLAVLLAQAATGLFANDDISTEGPLARLVSKALSDSVTGVHHLNSKILFALIGLHLSAIAFYFFRKRENLVKPMLTGFKESAAGAGDAAQRQGKIWLAALLLAACAGGVYFLVKVPAA